MFSTIKTRHALALAAGAALLGGCATYGMEDDGMASMSGQDTVMVGGAAMYPTRNIIENAINSGDHTTLVAAVKAAGLVDTLSGPGPFTVFAPTNAAFNKLPAGTVNSLMMPQNKAMLTSVLTYHVVPGRVSASQLMQMIRDGGGMAKLKTVNGATLTARMQGDHIVLVDAKGGIAKVTQADVFQSNGVIHVTDAVSLPG
tara:strand:- start:426 stop:1025 length:600 start_codon:yes stop_codon:yes gene_type:complete